MRVNFVFDVGDVRFLIALQYHFLMTCGQHVVRKCSLCITMTRDDIASLAGDWRSILTHNTFSQWRTSIRRLDLLLGVGFLCPWRVHNVGTNCCSISDSLGKSSAVPDLAGCALAAPTLSCSKPITTLTPPIPDLVFADVSTLSQPTPPARSNSIRLSVNSSSTVPPMLWNVTMLPLLHTWPTDMIDLCSRVFLGAT